MQINVSYYFGFNKSAAYLVFGKDTPEDGHDQPNLGQLQKIGRTQAHFPQIYCRNEKVLISSDKSKKEETSSNELLIRF